MGVKMTVNTARIIMFLKCNFRCAYCCNEKAQFNQQFQEVFLKEINWKKYKVVCVSGGEPFSDKEALFQTLQRIPPILPIYIYTNGILITKADVNHIAFYHANVMGFNIGIHGVNQPKFIIPEIDKHFSVRWQAQDKNREKLLSMYPDRINEQNAKFWKMDDCNRVNEDWFLLRDFENEEEQKNILTGNHRKEK
jgi:organic radical activating enzyme